jgi:5-methylcytosine-specific restriction endonuclease McrA
VPLGVKHTEEWKRNMSAIQKGRKHSKEHIEKCALAHRGLKHTEETKDKMSLARSGEKHWNWKGGIKKHKHYAHNQYIKNIEYFRKYAKKWRKEHPLSIRTYEYNRRVLEKGLNVKTLQLVYEDNIKRYGTLTCMYCNNPIPFGKDTIEHKMPLSRGGNNDYNNLGIACRSCNFSKQDKTIEEYKEWCKND